MKNIYSDIVRQFDFLKDYGLVFNYSESNGKLGDRHLQKFSYANPVLEKKIEIVYCTTNMNARLYGFLVNSNFKNRNQLDPQNFIPFDRLRCFFGEGSDIIFFGNQQYDFSYKLKEFKLVVKRFLSCLISKDWVDYEELLNHEKKIYVLTLEPQKYDIWANEIKDNDFIKKNTIVTYDASLEPPYEAYGLKLRSKNDIVFHITHGWKSRDEDGFSIQVTKSDKKTENHELMNVGTPKVVNFIKEMVST